MLTQEGKCPNCGAAYAPHQTYCRNCSVQIDPDDEVSVDSSEVLKWHLFIDKNSSRYVEIFSKNKDKKIFLNMNRSALFFSFYWMFYRKMYKYAIIFLAVYILFTFALTTIVTAAFRPAVHEAVQTYQSYTENEGEYTPNEVLMATVKYNQTIKVLEGRMYFWVIMPTIIIRVAFGGLADCIYRRYVLQNIKKERSGTSFWAVVGALIIFIITDIVSTPIINYIIYAIIR